MLVKDLLHTEFNALSSEVSRNKVLEQMEDHGLNIYPVIDQITGKYIGLITKKMMLERTRQMEDETELLTEISLYPVKAYPTQHLFEVAGIFLRNELRILPIVDIDNNFIGVIYKNEVFKTILNMLNLTELGSVLNIEVDQKDYVLSDIIRIIEMEGAKVLGVAIEAPSDTFSRIKISIKLNMTEIMAVSSSLKRHGFVITSESHDSSQSREYEERADEFLRYLEI
ncbi:MAG TPA: CBS domain-containing protein [Balneolales bacterium]|nr:CBS domain-containing protein [Balneolales bacterium]